MALANNPHDGDAMIHEHHIPQMEVNGATLPGVVVINTDDETVSIRHPRLTIDRLPFRTVDEIQKQIEADLSADGK